LSDQWQIDTSFSNTVWLFAIDSFVFANRNFSFQKYSPSTSTWTTLQPFPVSYSYAFSLLSKGYIVLGMDTATSIPNQLWEYDPASDQWNRKADFLGANIYGGGAAFTVKDKAYLAGGFDTLFSISNQFWEYEPVNDMWTAKADIIGPRIGCFGVEYNNKGFFGFGLDDPTGVDYCDLRKYDPVSDTWSSAIAQPLGCRNNVLGFASNNKFFIGSGKDRYTLGYSDDLYDFWMRTFCPQKQ
jgi:N-acetylneuraminic acid mutarotase